MKTQLQGLLCLAIFSLLFATPWSTQAAAGARRRDAKYLQERANFVQGILSNLTLQGKIGQMTQLNIDMLLVSNTANVVDATKMKKAVSYGVGSFLNNPVSGGPINGVIGLNASQWITLVNAIQTQVMTATPANISSTAIPMVYGLDSVHGADYVYGATLFPHNTGLAATFNPSLAYQAAAITAKDTRTAGVPWIWAPVLGLGVQPLWPRIYETFGEDPYLVSVMADAVVNGMQNNGSLSQNTAAAACIKHYLGYPAAKSGKDRTPAWIPDRFLFRYFVPPFQAGVDAGAASLMINSGEINGVPVHASREYLTDLLRNDLFFEGVAVTDWQDIEKLYFYHHVAASQRDAVRMAIDAGVDMSMVPEDYSFPLLLLDLVQSGEISEARIDYSVTRILNFKYDLGLFTNPYADPNNPNINTIGSQQDRQVSLNAARESITLLKNNGILPLSTSIRNVLITGPSGNSITNQNGGWSIFWQGATSDNQFPYGTTIYEGVQQVVSGATTVNYFQGADFDQVTNIQAAVTAAQNADACIVAVGEAPESETPGDTNDLTLSAPQLQLISAISATGCPVILVLIEPRPRILGAAATNASAILMAYLPATEGGQAIAEILFGVVNPSGKLPLTYPQFTGDIGVQYYKKYSDTTSPLYTFGDGLSYTTWQYSNLVLSNTQITLGSNIGASVTVRNSGSVAGKETVLLYLSDFYASITPEVKMLKRFQKVSLNPGQQTTVSFTLTPDDMSFIDLFNLPRIEPGVFGVSVGNLSANFTVV